MKYSDSGRHVSEDQYYIFNLAPAKTLSSYKISLTISGSKTNRHRTIHEFTKSVKEGINQSAIAVMFTLREDAYYLHIQNFLAPTSLSILMESSNCATLTIYGLRVCETVANYVTVSMCTESVSYETVNSRADTLTL